MKKITLLLNLICAISFGQTSLTFLNNKCGILNTSPSYTLDVTGQVRSSAQMAVNGGMDQTFAFTITGKTSSWTTGGAVRIVNSASSEMFRLLDNHKWCFYDEAGLGKYSRLEIGSTDDVDARIYVRGWDKLGTHFGLWITDSQEEVKNFVVANNGHIYMGNLPYSPIGLESGEVYVDTVSIVGKKILCVK